MKENNKNFVKGKEHMKAREQWLEEDCVYVHTRSCDMCPYAVYDKDGICKCELEVYEHCIVMEDET